MPERWRDIPEWVGLYQASTLGRIRSIARWKILRRHKTKYPSVQLCRDGKHTRYNVHVLVLRTFRGLCPSGQESRHLNDNKDDATLRNLRYGTKRQNKQDMKRNGISCAPKTPRSGYICLTDLQITEAAKLSRNGWSQRELAIKYGVSHSTIGRILPPVQKEKTPSFSYFNTGA